MPTVIQHGGFLLVPHQKRIWGSAFNIAGSFVISTRSAISNNAAAKRDITHVVQYSPESYWDPDQLGVYVVPMESVIEISEAGELAQIGLKTRPSDEEVMLGQARYLWTIWRQARLQLETMQKSGYWKEKDLQALMASESLPLDYRYKKPERILANNPDQVRERPALDNDHSGQRPELMPRGR